MAIIRAITALAYKDAMILFKPFQKNNVSVYKKMVVVESGEATGCHGSGIKYQTISDDAVGFEILKSDVSIIKMGDFIADDKSDEKALTAARLSLGMFGIILAIMFRVLPSYKVSATEIKAPIDEALSKTKDYVLNNEYIEFLRQLHNRDGEIQIANNTEETVTLSYFAPQQSLFDRIITRATIIKYVSVTIAVNHMIHDFVFVLLFLISFFWFCFVCFFLMLLCKDETMLHLITAWVNVILSTPTVFKRDNPANDTFNDIEMACEYNVYCIVCIGCAVDSGKTGTILKTIPTSQLNNPQDIDNHDAEVDLHQPVIHTQLSPNDEKQMPHTIIIPTTVVGTIHSAGFHSIAASTPKNKKCALMHPRIVLECCVFNPKITEYIKMIMLAIVVGFTVLITFFYNLFFVLLILAMY